MSAATELFNRRLKMNLFLNLFSGTFQITDIHARGVFSKGDWPTLQTASVESRLVQSVVGLGLP
jgi:hypothetical protein